MRSILIILATVVFLILLPVWLLAPPISGTDRDQQTYFAAKRRLSEPALAGGVTFANRCAGCHGSMGHGTEHAPSLLTRRYATDYRDAPAFHAAVGATILAHQQVTRAARNGSGLDFNELEMMAKFLREMRLARRRIEAGL